MNYKECKEKLKRYSLARIPFIPFYTIERQRALDILRETAKDLSLPFYVHTLSKGMYDIVTEKSVNDDKTVIGALDFIAEQINLKANLTFIFTDVSELDADTTTARYIFDIVNLAEEKGASIIVITQDTVWSNLQRLGMSLDLDLPSEDEVYDIIAENIEPYKNSIKVDWDENDYREAALTLTGITKVEIQNVIVSLIASRHIKKADLLELKFAKDKLFSDINGLEKIEVSSDIADVGGLGGLKNWLNDKKKLQVSEKRDELTKRGLNPPRGILLVGVPGCGKSLSAKAVASYWNLPLYRLDFATVQGQYVGQSEQQLKEAFQTAERVSPCVLWIDEIEKGLSGGGSDSSGVTTRMIGQFLFWMQECKKMVFVVATANDVSELPSELLRRGRFDELFFIDLPSEEERKDIINLYLKKYLNSSVDENTLKELIEITDGFTGADLESSIRDVAYRVIANDDLKFTSELIINALKNVIPLSKTSPEKIEYIRDWGRERAVPASNIPIGGKNDDNKLVRRVLV
ncbi:MULTISPECIES: AAA family ATPase [Brachyspira]|uniref:AAA family ATPase n=1 Tax=Brachyspira TaxID=29521 RepID=UPI00262A6E6D|nr:AAA family ATPase [uncultured Brachyspira sp.]